MSDTAQVHKNMRVDNHGPRGRLNTLSLLEKYNTKMIPNNILLYP